MIVDRYEKQVRETRLDKVLSKVLEHYQTCWNRFNKKINNSNDELRHLYNIKSKILLEKKIIYYKDRLVIPQKLR